MITDSDLMHLKRCIELAKVALESGDQPFGSVLVAADGHVLREERNHVGDGDHTKHPEFALARWAAEHMTLEEIEKATVFTSGEHCPMCAAAHGWVGLGRIVYVSSSEQLVQWLTEFGVDVSQSRVRSLPIQDVIRNTRVDGPVPELAEQVRELYRQFYMRIS
ncbi:nucleoside deaminase [Sporosarcina siberiensis]|uniref:Nucleoside deaminase n=1 Tax=Sporosarcina siberiensis TaxID=1365606 RepID=A0ABW4SH35_9BACL